jgi:YVTN family beta-propeller protein
VALPAQRPTPDAAADPGVVTTGQRITPAGVQATFEGRTYGVAFGASTDEVWALVRTAEGTEVSLLSTGTNRVVRRLALADRPGTQALQFDSTSKEAFVGAVGTVVKDGQRRSVVNLLKSGPQSLVHAANGLGSNQVGALAIAAGPDPLGRRIAVVPLTYNNQAAIVDLRDGRDLGRLPTEIAPFGAVVNANGTAAYVTNWGGRLARSGEHTLTSGNPIEADTTDKAAPDPVVVDERGVAATGSVTRLDLTTMRALTSIAVGLHPTAMAWDQPHARLYVANSNSDSISVIDSTSDRVVQTIAIQPFEQRLPGEAPTALAIDASARRLYVACGGINAVAVVEATTGTLLGLIPTAWYPSTLSLSADGRRLAVGALLGEGSGWQISGPALANHKRQYEPMHIELPAPARRYVHAYRGTVNVIDLPDATALASFTTAVAQNNRLTLASAAPASDLAPRPGASPKPIPERVGEPSLIEHVVYIIKENRTYDQLFGDLGKGNGDPSLVMYGERITPNQRRLAREFVLLDNFYATGGNSGDGHQWATQANETEYTLWPGYAGRSYPFGGDDPIAVARGGFIWDEAVRRRMTVQLFGEYVGYGYPPNPTPQEIATLRRAQTGEGATRPEDVKGDVAALKARVGDELQRKVAAWRAGADFSGRWHNVAPNDALNAIMVHDYPAWGFEEIPDVVRAQVFTAHLKRWEAAGAMPNLSIVHLPSDHTEGTVPFRPTPRASVADNDWALGVIVDALSHSQFWRTMAIFVVEDDAQNGVDHVDGHRTVALAISPYTRRGAVDSTFYAQQSMLKTIELILGLSPLSIFDLTATEMRASFQDAPNLSPYTAVEPAQSIVELNPPANSLPTPARQGALASARMRFDVVDRAPTEALNRILWHDARGWHTPYPRSRSSAFSPFALDLADQDRDVEVPGRRSRE